MNEKQIRFRNQLCFPMYLYSKEVTGEYTKLLKKYNLTYTQYIVMMYLWYIDTSNLKEMSKALMLDPSTLSPLLGKLKAKGFVEKKRLDRDERNLVITLTQKGKDLRESVCGISRQVSARIGLSDEAAKQLQEITEKLLLNLRKQKKDDA